VEVDVNWPSWVYIVAATEVYERRKNKCKLSQFVNRMKILAVIVRSDVMAYVPL